MTTTHKFPSKEGVLKTLFVVQESVFKSHVETVHDMGADEYSNNFGTPALSLQLYTCLVRRINF